MIKDAYYMQLKRNQKKVSEWNVGSKTGRPKDFS